MPPEVFEFLDGERIGVVSVEMSDGSPHGATVHFAYLREPFALIVMTDTSYRKMESLNAHGSTRASFVIGTDESKMRTFQLDGTALLPDGEQYAEAYFAKFPEKRAKFEAPDDVFFIFKPTWWRFTDYKAPKDKQVISSEG